MNDAQQPRAVMEELQPVAWRYRYLCKINARLVWGDWHHCGHKPLGASNAEYQVEPLYAAPPRTAPTDEWRPIETAPKDGTAVLLRFASVMAGGSEWADLVFVGRNRGNYMDWGFAAPVGVGGFPDEWLAGWMPLPAPPGAHLKGQVLPADGVGPSHE